jgi:hypothetical protein
LRVGDLCEVLFGRYTGIVGGKTPSSLLTT